MERAEFVFKPRSFPKSFRTFKGLCASDRSIGREQEDKKISGTIEQEILTQEENHTQATRQLDVVSTSFVRSY
jgi:hypothetical protein